MAQEKPNKLAEWMEIVREQSPTWKDAVRTWVAQVAENPAQIWQNTVIRYSVLAIGGIMLLLIIDTGLKAVTPPIPEGAKEQAVTADYHVICTQASCGSHFVINRRFGFNRFPVTCNKCEMESGAKAVKCPRSTCQKWVAPIKEDDQSFCPYCDYKFEK